MSSEQQENDSPPRTPVSHENSSFFLLSPPMLVHHEETNVNENNEYSDGDQEEHITRENLGARQVPPFPMMGRNINTNGPFSTSRENLAISTRRRSCSFDDRHGIPLPSFHLRPRYRRGSEAFERNSRQESLSANADVDLPANRKRSHHRRSYTFDGTTGYPNMFEFARVHSPPSDIRSIATLYPQQPASQFSPLGSCSIDSPHIAHCVARPIPRHSTLSTTPATSTTTTNGMGTISSSNNSAFESASSSMFAGSLRMPSPYDDVSGFEESVRDIDGCTLPIREVRVVENRQIQSHPYDDELLTLYDSPNSNGSDRCIENLNSLRSLTLQNFDGEIFSSDRPSPVQPIRPSPVQLRPSPVQAIRPSPVQLRPSPVQAIRPSPVQLRPSPVPISSSQLYSKNCSKSP